MLYNNCTSVARVVLLKVHLYVLNFGNQQHGKTQKSDCIRADVYCIISHSLLCCLVSVSGSWQRGHQ